ncbi:MAG TPA: rhamnulokinase family protein [Verrucomicrobiae bacterium]
MTTHHYLACDLGAESGRLMLGTLREGRVTLEEIYRFPNPVLRQGESMHWDIPQLFTELKSGLRLVAKRKLPIASISTDSWGLDYVLFDAQGALIPPTFHYRDPRTARGVERVFSLTKWEHVFAETGIQFMPINSLYQLAAESPERLRNARLLLSVADAFNYFLSGNATVEESMASTFQLYNPRTRNWSDYLINLLKLPRSIFPHVASSCTSLGPIKHDLADELSLKETQVIATCSHDTGAAVAAVPAKEKNWAYLSSGTWSLLGVELDKPVLTDLCRTHNFTNELGYGGTVRLLKNIVGLWVIQECRRQWAADGNDIDYGTLTRLAADAPPFTAIIDLTDPRFVSPGGMPAKIAAFCRETKQPEPVTPGAIARCVLESLALQYDRTLRQAEEVSGLKTEVLHIVGGGSQNRLLNRFAANATGRTVIAGPVEATALGNVILQSITLGHLPTLSAAREIIATSFYVETYEPTEIEAWQIAARKLAQLMVKK